VKRVMLLFIFSFFCFGLAALPVRNISTVEFTTYADDSFQSLYTNTLVYRFSRAFTLEAEAGYQENDYIQSPRFKGGAFFTLPFLPGAYSECYYQWYKYYDKALYPFSDPDDIPSTHKLYYDVTSEKAEWYWNSSLSGTYNPDTWSLTGAGAAKWYGHDIWGLFGKYIFSAVSEPDEMVFDHTVWVEGSAKPDNVVTFRTGTTLGLYNTPFEDDILAFHGSFLIGARLQMTSILALLWGFEYSYSETRQSITNGFTIDINFI